MLAPHVMSKTCFHHELLSPHEEVCVERDWATPQSTLAPPPPFPTLNVRSSESLNPPTLRTDPAMLRA